MCVYPFIDRVCSYSTKQSISLAVYTRFTIDTATLYSARVEFLIRHKEPP